MAKSIFTISGLRGIFGEDLTPETTIKYAIKFGKYLKAKNIAIGRDTRFSGPALFHSMVSGFFTVGTNVYDFGICPTPAIVMMVRKLNLDGGIQITASHNPEEWNGLKFISPKGRFLFGAELQNFKRYLNKKETARFGIDPIGLRPIRVMFPPSIYKTETIDSYINNIISADCFKKIPNKKFKIGIDSCNGAAEESAVKLVELFGAIPISIKNKSFGFPRRAEPISENLKRLCSIVRKQGLNFGIAFDPDGDRFSCVDELGVPLGEEATILLALEFLLKQKKGPVVVNNSTTMAVQDICRKYNVSLYRSKVGEANVVEKMQEINAIIGGEGNGGVIFPEINYARDGLVATAILIKLLSSEKCPLSVIRKSLPKYFMVKMAIKKYNENWRKIAKREFSGDKSVRFDNQDGLKIIGDDFWILLRKSRTEPILRIMGESKRKNYTNKLIKELVKQIQRFGTKE